MHDNSPHALLGNIEYLTAKYRKVLHANTCIQGSPPEVLKGVAQERT